MDQKLEKSSFTMGKTWTLTNNYNNWEALASEFDWVRDMENVPQDPIYHAEGNVAIHTKMVLQALQQLGEFQQLEAQDQEILLAAALLHDVEKRSTTIVDCDQVRSPNHSRKGAQTARVLLYRNQDAPYYIREHIVHLVRYHGFPLWFMEKGDMKKQLLKVSLLVNTKLLYLLAKADILGRDCEDKESLLEQIAFFKAYCQEWNCFGQPKAFENQLALYHYFNTESSYEGYQPFEQFKSEVTLMIALPGSGKDYFIKHQLPEIPVISLDNLRRERNIKHGDKKGNGQVIQEAKQLSKKYLAAGTNFVWNATNISQEMRKQLIELFTSYNAKVTLAYIEVPYKTLLHQNRNRPYPIPEKSLERMISRWQAPAIFEAHDITFII